MHEYIIHDSFHDPYIMFLQEKKKKFTLSPLKRVFFSPARKLGGLHWVVTAPDVCVLGYINYNQSMNQFCLDCFHEYLTMVMTAARRMTTLGQLWDDFGTTLGRLWDNFGTTLGQV